MLLKASGALVWDRHDPHSPWSDIRLQVAPDWQEKHEKAKAWLQSLLSPSTKEGCPSALSLLLMQHPEHLHSG